MLRNMDQNIRLAIVQQLENILHQDKATRSCGEEKLSQLKFTEGYGVHLSEIVVNCDLNLSLRQLASVMLKQYVEAHWSLETDEDPSKLVVTDQAKKAIKQILPPGLSDDNSKIRSVVAYTISSIASFDWPSDWEELFDIIVKCLASNENSVHGAMQVLVEFTYELAEQVKEVGPMILSEVYRIFEAESIYTLKTRSCAVGILNSLLKCINTHVEKQEQLIMLNPILPTFMEKLIQGLTIPNGPLSSFELKTEILKVLTYLVSETKYCNNFVPQLLPPIWLLLTQMADVYIKYVVNDSSEATPFNDDGEEDEKNQFIKMVLQIFEFIHAIVEVKKFKASIKGVISDLVYILLIYMQITEEQIEVWAEDPEKFVEDEDENGVDYSVRTSAQDILMLLGSECEEELMKGLSNAVQRHVAVADSDRNSNKPFWWKTHESSMLAVGSFKDLILENEEKFSLSAYLNLVRNLLSYQVSPFLMGRCIWTLSKFVESDLYNVQLLEEVCNTTIASLSQDKSIVLRIGAIRAVYCFCTNLKETDNNDLKVCLASKLNIFLDGIMLVVSVSQNTVLGLILETLSVMLSFDATFTANSAPKVIPLITALFLKFHDDRFLLGLVQEILKILSQNPYCLQPLQEKIIPTLVSILNLQGEKTSAPMQEIALDVLETVVKYSKPPLSDVLIDHAFPAAVNCILSTEDHSVMQSGGECLRAFLFVSPEQVCTYKNGEGLNQILQVTTMLLNPMSTEFTASFIGRLVITLITKAGNYLGENIDLLLKAVISKMQLVESLNVIMSLVMTFGHLILIQMEAVLNFLSTVPGPSGEPAMNFVFLHWLSRQHLFYGTYERKVSTMALCKLFEYGITTKDARLINVTIKDPVEVPTSKARTRSQTTQQQWASIPILVKIFKLLINELSNLRELKEAVNVSINDDGSEDDEANGEDGSPGKNFSASMLYDDEETDEDDNQLLQELQQDPIFQEDMETNLTKFLLNFTQDEHFGAFVEHLNENEQKILQQLRKA